MLSVCLVVSMTRLYMSVLFHLFVPICCEANGSGSGFLCLYTSPGLDNFASQLALINNVHVHCGLPGRHNNFAMCDGCNRCFHVRYLVRPMSVDPSGTWYCLACNPCFGEEAGDRIDELEDVCHDVSFIWPM
jgi:hypothetical protein